MLIGLGEDMELINLPVFTRSEVKGTKVTFLKVRLSVD